MAVESEIRWQGWRALPRAVWLFLALAGLYVALRIVTDPTLQPLSTLNGVAPFLFAAAVAYARPQDRRFRWATWAIAAYVALPYIFRALPELVFRFAPGDWKNGAFPLQEALGVISFLPGALLIIGLTLFGLALGGVRSAFGGAILVVGAVVALADLTWLVAHTVEEMPLLDLAYSAVFTTLNTLAWAFAFAAAIDAVRSFVIVGTGLLFANVVVNTVLLLWEPGPATNFDILLVIIAGLGLGGWLALACGALRGELTGPSDARSRAGQRSALRPRVG